MNFWEEEREDMNVAAEATGAESYVDENGNKSYSFWRYSPIFGGENEGCWNAINHKRFCTFSEAEFSIVWKRNETITSSNWNCFSNTILFSFICVNTFFVLAHYARILQHIFTHRHEWIFFSFFTLKMMMMWVSGEISGCQKRNIFFYGKWFSTNK